MEILSTADVSNMTLDVLVYGDSGVGKTRLISTIPSEKILVLSAENGLLSLRDFDFPYVVIDGIETLHAVGADIKRGTLDYEWFAIDSISEIAETCLIREKEKTKDPRRAYGVLQDTIKGFIRFMRDLPVNTYFTAKTGTSNMKHVASMPNGKLQDDLPFFFDEVLAMYTVADEEGVVGRVLQTQDSPQFNAKDRSGSLDTLEPANLTHIYKKIFGDKL